MKSEKISVYQFLLIVILFSIGTSILTLPQALASAAKNDGWIAATISIPMGVIAVWLFNTVSSLYPNLTLIELNEKIFGKWIGNTVSILFVFFCLKNAAAVTYEVGDFLATYVLPKTPIQATMIMLSLIVVMGMRLGLEVLARAAEVLFPWFCMLFVILVISISPQVSLENIQPVFENGMKPTIKGALNVTSVSFLPMIVLLMFFPSCVTSTDKAKRAFLKGTVIGGVMLVIITFLNIAVLGHEITGRSHYVSYILARHINVGNFLQRIEAIIAAMFFISMYFKVTFYFYGCIVGLAQVLKLKDYRLLVMPLTMILIVFGLISYPNVIEAAQWNSTIWIPYSITMGFLYPLLLLVAAKIKSKFYGISNRSTQVK